jgi:hypothetical protein
MGKQGATGGSRSLSNDRSTEGKSEPTGRYKEEMPHKFIKQKKNRTPV